MRNPRISVVMPVRDCEKYLPLAIESILSQTFDDFEFIIVNDGSTDRTDEVIRRYLQDPRLVYEDNGAKEGIVYSLNRGIEMARADIIARMDADDISMPDRFELQYRFLQDNPDIALVGSSVELIDFAGRSIGLRSVVTGPENIRRIFFYYGPHRQPTIMVRKEALLSIGGYRDYMVCQDIDLYFRLILSGMKTDNLPDVLVKYRVHGENSDRHFKKKAGIALEIKKNAIDEFSFKPSFVEHLSMYIHYCLDMTLKPSRKHQVETAAKWLVDRYEGLRRPVAGRLKEARVALSIRERSGRMEEIAVVPAPVKKAISKAGSLIFSLVFPNRTFAFRGRVHAYLYHPYKLAWYTERGVEVPIALEQVKRYKGRRILEVGHVLGHYYPIDHDVIDKYETAPGVENVDVVDFRPESKYDLIVSISTMEHVGYDECLKDPGKIAEGMEGLRGMLAPGGRMFVTIPLGYNPEADRLVSGEWADIYEICFMRKTSWLNRWEECSGAEAFRAVAEQRYFWINALAVLTLGTEPETRGGPLG